MRLALCLILVSSTAAARGMRPPVSAKRRANVVMRPDSWNTIRSARVIVVGKVTKVVTVGHVTMSVTRVLKGKNVGKTLTFTNHYGSPGKGAIGATWLVYLEGQGTKPAYYYMINAASGAQQVARNEAIARQVLKLDGLRGNRAKCKFLVEMICASPTRLARAEQELRRHNADECVDLLAPLAEKPKLKSFYISLLSRNPSPRAVRILRGFLKTEKGHSLRQLIRVLGLRASGNRALGGDLLELLKSSDPVIRAEAIAALERCGFRAALPRVAECLSDPDGDVRRAALGWPWKRYAGEHPQVLDRIRRMSGAPAASERALACATLVDLGDVRSFYGLWRRSLFDPDQYVRKSINLAALWESRPFSATALILWPALLALAAAILIARRLRARGTGFRLAAGVLAGYALGVVVGTLIGKYHGGGGGFGAFVLTPALALPPALALALAWSWAGKSSAEAGDAA